MFIKKFRNLRHVEATKELEKLFNFLTESDIFICEQTALNISRFLKDIGGSAKTTTIKTNSKVFLPFGNESKYPSCGGLFFSDMFLIWWWMVQM